MFTLIIKSAILCFLSFFLSAMIGRWLGRSKTTQADLKEPLLANPKPLVREPSIPVTSASVSSKLSEQPKENHPDLTQMSTGDLETLISKSKAQKPETLSKPKGSPDDLKLIIGIGPVNEKELNSLGIYHFWQIADWTPEHIAWVSSRIRFAGRITRENWMRQARTLMKTS